MSRCWAALYPRDNFLDVLEGNPDLYGPFWIATTVILILFLGGTISQYLASKGAGPFAYDFELLSGKSCVVLFIAFCLASASYYLLQRRRHGHRLGSPNYSQNTNTPPFNY